MVLAFLLAVLDQNIEQYFRERQIQKALAESRRQLGIFWGNDAGKTFGDWIESREKSLQIRTERELIRREERQIEEAVLKILWKIDQEAKEDHESGREALNRRLEQVCEKETKRCDERQESISQKLERGFAFLEESYGTGAELALFAANLTRNDRIRKFLGTYGCPAYTRYEQQLLGGEKLLKTDAGIWKKGQRTGIDRKIAGRIMSNRACNCSIGNHCEGTERLLKFLNAE